jgi:hypothetical protein
MYFKQEVFTGFDKILRDYIPKGKKKNIYIKRVYKIH